MTNTRTKQKERTLYIILAAALAARLLLALVTEGYTYDMSCFVAWGDKLASEGPAAFYSADYFADYPPGYILVLGLVSLVRKALQLSYESRWTYFLLALIPAICDCAAVVLLDHISRRYMGQGRAQRCLVLFAAFCPLTLFDTGIWKQIDGAFALPLLLCLGLLLAGLEAWVTEGVWQTPGGTLAVQYTRGYTRHTVWLLTSDLSLTCRQTPFSESVGRCDLIARLPCRTRVKARAVKYARAVRLKLVP